MTLKAEEHKNMKAHLLMMLEAMQYKGNTKFMGNERLRELVEEQKVKVETKGDRKVFEITKTGKDALASARGDMKENATETGETSDKSASESSAKSTGWDSVFIVAASKLGPVLLDVAQTGSRDQQKRATEILAETRHQLHQILAEK